MCQCLDLMGFFARNYRRLLKFWSIHLPSSHFARLELKFQNGLLCLIIHNIVTEMEAFVHGPMNKC
jgi:hypothetical protein